MRPEPFSPPAPPQPPASGGAPFPSPPARPSPVPPPPRGSTVTTAVLLGLALLIAVPVWFSEPGWSGREDAGVGGALGLLGFTLAALLALLGIAIGCVAAMKWIGVLLERPPALPHLRWLRWALPLAACVLYPVLGALLLFEGLGETTDVSHGVSLLVLSGIGVLLPLVTVPVNLVLLLLGIRANLRLAAAERG